MNFDILKYLFWINEMRCVVRIFVNMLPSSNASRLTQRHAQTLTSIHYVYCTINLCYRNTFPNWISCHNIWYSFQFGFKKSRSLLNFAYLIYVWWDMTFFSKGFLNNHYFTLHPDEVWSQERKMKRRLYSKTVLEFSLRCQYDINVY